MSRIAVIRMAKRKKLIRLFKKAGATNAGSTLNVSEKKISDTSLIFLSLVKDQIIVNVGNKIYYLDEAKEQEIAMQQQKMLFVYLFVAILILALGLYGLYKNHL
jgi:uncharacterized membrane-anchored protein